MLVGDREKDMRTDRYVFFSETSTSQHHNVVLQHIHFHTHTHTLTHMTGQQWLTGQVVPDFSGFANIFDPERGSQEFFGCQGVTQHPKIFPECLKCFLLFMFVLYAGTMLRNLRLC